MDAVHGSEVGDLRLLEAYLWIVRNRLLHCDVCFSLAVQLCFISLCAYMRDCKWVYVVVLAFLLDFCRWDQG